MRLLGDLHDRVVGDDGLISLKEERIDVNH